MEQIQQFVASAWSSVAPWFSVANLQVLLLVGSGVLAISLLVLALTRWGHSRPVWKCVMLSFVAHILLLGYASATYVIPKSKQPKVIAEEPSEVNLIEEMDLAKLSDGERQHRRTSEWDQLADQTIENLDIAPLDRALVDSELVVEPTAMNLPSSTSSSDVRPATSMPRDLTALAPDNLDAVSRMETPEIRQSSRSPESSISVSNVQSLDAQPIEITRRGEDVDPVADDLPNFGDLASQEMPDRQAIVPRPLKRDRPTSKMADAETKNSVLPKPKRQLPRFAGSQPMTKQVSVKSSSLEFARKATTGSVSGPIKVSRGQRRLGDGQPLPKSYSLRSIENRLEVAQRNGGSALTERAVNAAHGWLVTQQKTDGRWSAGDSGAGRETETFGHDRNGAGAQADTGITGLATLSLLASGHSHFEGSYKQNVQRALEYLVSQQSSDGNLAGNAKLFARMYCHSMALLAISEALAVTGDQRLLPAVQSGVDYCVAAQNRNDGGWRYQPGDGGDMSQFGWVLMAMRSAKLGGAVIPAGTFQGMRYFLRKCSSGPGKALASYRPGQGASTAMTAEALFCRYLLDEVPAREGLRTASRRISQERPSRDQMNLYYWYYATLALRNVGGDAWQQWNARLKATLVSKQETSGSNAGSWKPDGLWGGYGGRVYSTSMAALNLQVYYRYAPTHEFANAR